jgi:hypothetical protein
MRMKLSWKDYCTWLELLARRKLGEIESVTVEWMFDDTPSAGFLGLGLHRFAGTKHAWVRFRERPDGIFFQVGDAPWRSMPGLDSESVGQLLESFILGFAVQQDGYAVTGPNNDAAAEIASPGLRYSRGG